MPGWLPKPVWQASRFVQFTVLRVLPGRDAVTVETDAGEFRAAIVVGADGSNGVTRRCILPNEPIHTARALELLLPLADQASGKWRIRRVFSPTCLHFPDLFPSPELGGGGKGRGLNTHRRDVAYFDFSPVWRGSPVIPGISPPR